MVCGGLSFSHRGLPVLFGYASFLMNIAIIGGTRAKYFSRLLVIHGGRSQRIAAAI